MRFILNWIWPRDRCRSGSQISIADWRTDYLHTDLQGKSLGIIQRAADGRFILRDADIASRAGSISNYSSSDDGGFLPKRGRNKDRTSWRRPLVGYPSQLSLRSDGSGQSARGGLANFFGGLVQQRFHAPKPIPVIYTLQPQPPLSPNTPRFQSSSPTTSSNLLLSPWSPLYCSDLSSVRQSSGDRSYPTPPGFMQLRTMHERYSQELPSLRAIHEETFNNQFIPVHPITASPVTKLRFPPTYQNTMTARPRAKLLPRHARIARSAPELASPDQVDASPDSRSSSSGFGSKNTSSNPNQSSQSGSTLIEWRVPPTTTFTGWGLPPYRPPPPPPLQIFPLPPPPPMVGRWLELAYDSPGSDPPHKAVDVGSVDGHYEFDPSTPTPTPSTPTGDIKTLPRLARYDNIEARVQAMKEEFHEFRKRQAKRRRSHELESVC